MLAVRAMCAHCHPAYLNFKHKAQTSELKTVHHVACYNVTETSITKVN